MLRRIGLASALAVGLALAAPNGAVAATTVGQTFVPLTPNTCLGGPDWELTQTGRASGPSYAAPSAGVLTSWSFQAGSQETVLTLRVFHPTGTPHQYQVVADGGLLQTVPGSSGLHTFPTQISVQAGDLIGVHSTSGECGTITASTADTYDYHSGTAFPVGAIADYTSGTAAILDIAARHEPDCDRDGLGDETQDSNLSCATGQRAAAIKKCKKKFKGKAKAKKRKKCIKKAKKLPV